jgi:hypothetical protein
MAGPALNSRASNTTRGLGIMPCTSFIREHQLGHRDFLGGQFAIVFCELAGYPSSELQASPRCANAHSLPVGESTMIGSTNPVRKFLLAAALSAALVGRNEANWRLAAIKQLIGNRTGQSFFALKRTAPASTSSQNRRSSSGPSPSGIVWPNEQKTYEEVIRQSGITSFWRRPLAWSLLQFARLDAGDPV